MSTAPIRTDDARAIVAEWIAEERACYADNKFSGANLELRMKAARDRDWQTEIDFIAQYLKKAQIFGFDTPQGLQQLGKAAVTVIATFERVIEAHQVIPPEPGHTSGEIKEWSGA